MLMSKHVDLAQLKFLVFWAAYQVATLVKCKSWKAMMDSGKDPKESILPFLWLIVNWLLAVTNSIIFHDFSNLICTSLMQTKLT